MMPFSQQDLGSDGHTSNTYLSFADQDLRCKINKINSADPLAGPSCDHWQFCEKVNQRSEGEADFLSSPNATLDNPGSSPRTQEEKANVKNLATYLKAFALIYVLPEVDWTVKNIDMLLAEGTDIFSASSEMDQPDDDDQGETQVLHPEHYTDEMRILRKFNLEGHTFTLALEPRYLGKAARPSEQHRKHTIINLRRILQSFFKSSRYCLLLTRVGNLLVWRRREVFFVLNVKDRRRHDLQGDKDKRVAMLVCLKSIDNVVHLARKLSGLTTQDEITIRELVVVRLETPDGRIYMRDSSSRSIGIKFKTKSYAYLKTNLHLPLNQNDAVKNRSSLMVAVGSILASKVHHPSNWDTNMLDHLVCYGVELCSSCWSDCLRDRRPLDLDTFPTQLRLGQFVLEIKLIPNVKTGHWKCGISIIGTDFVRHVREAFKKYSNVVFQINNQMYAMWAKDDFYYLLDPYRHSVVGSHSAEDKGAKWATVRMFRDQRTLLSVFHQLLKESNRQSSYYLHVVRIRNFAECPKGLALAPLPENVDTLDLESLNEPILFGDQPGVSEWDKFLKEISDYEDEEKLKILKERYNVGGMEAKAHLTHTRRLTKKNLKNSKSKTRTPKNAAPRKPSQNAPKKPSQNAKQSTSATQSLTKKEKKFFKHFQASKKSAIDIQESEKMPMKNFPRLMKRKLVQLPQHPKISVLSTLFNRQTGGTVSEHSLCLGRVPNVKSAKDILIMRRDASLKASEPRKISSEGNSTPKCGPIRKPQPISPQTPVRDIIQQSMEKTHFRKPNSNNTELISAGRCSGGVAVPPEKNEYLPRFPGFNREPQLLAVVGSESGTVESLNRVLGSAFKVANRVLTMTPWGNFVIFRHRPNDSSESSASWFYLFDGCTCDIDRFRHLDLSRGTAGLVSFPKLSEVVCHLIDLREKKALKMLCPRVKEKEQHHKRQPQISAH